MLEDRYDTRSTITSQIDHTRWHEHIAEPTHADAICDRLIHRPREHSWPWLLPLKKEIARRIRELSDIQTSTATVRISDITTNTNKQIDRNMLKEPTIEKLKATRLDAMASAWNEQHGKPDLSQLSFDERFGMLVDAEWLQRENKRLSTALREAKLKLSSACIEGIDFSAKRELDRAQLRQLASCRWVAEHQNILITGMTGTGKTYVACALAQQACRKGHRAIYRRASRLFSELALARADGTYPRLLAKIARADVLVLDDWAMAPITEVERRDLLEVLEDRYDTRSTIITSQIDHTRWHEHIGDPTHADAICDRLIHNAHKLMLKGPSKRKNAETKTEK